MLSRDEFAAYLTPDEMATIRDCILGGLADYDDPANYGAAARRDHTKALRSHIRNAHMNARAQRASMDQPRMQFTPVRGRPLFTIGDQVSLSLKRLDKNHRPRGNRTRQAQVFLAQIPLPLDVPEATNLVAGYTALDEFETDFEVYVVSPGPKHNHWELRLEGPGVADVIGAKPSPEEPRRRVVVRSDRPEAAGAKDADAAAR